MKLVSFALPVFAAYALAATFIGSCSGTGSAAGTDASSIKAVDRDAGAAETSSETSERLEPPEGTRSRFDEALPQVETEPLEQARAFKGLGKYADLLAMVDTSPLPDVTECERVTGGVFTREDELVGSSHWHCAVADPPVFVTDDLRIFIAGDLKDRIPAYLFVDGVKPETLPGRGPLAMRKREPEPTKPASFEADLKALLKRPIGEDLVGRNMRYRTAVYVYWLVRGYWAARLGQTGLAKKCLARAVKLADKHLEGWESKDVDARRQLESEFAASLDLTTRELVAAYADDRTSLAYARYVRKIADSKSASELVLSLERRAALRRQYADFIEKEPDAVKDRDRVDLLLFQLMETNKRLNIWAGEKIQLPTKGYRSPGAELATMGRKVVPALIDRLDDPALTRAILRDGWKGTRAIDSMTLGEQVLQVLNAISGLSFGYSTDAATREKVEAWWAKAKGASKTDMAAEALMHAADYDRGKLAVKLLREQGKMAWPHISAAFDKIKDFSAKEYFVACLDKAAALDDSPALEFFHRATKDADWDVQARGMAALIRRGKHRVVAKVVDALGKKPGELTENALKALLPLGNGAIFKALFARLEKGNVETYRTYASALSVMCRDDMADYSPDRHGEKCGISDEHRSRLIEHFEAIVGRPQPIKRQYATVLDYVIDAYNDITQQDTHRQADYEGLTKLLEVINVSRRGRGLQPLTRPDLAPPEMPTKPVPWDRAIGRVHVIARPDSVPKDVEEWLGSFTPGRQLDLSVETARAQRVAKNNLEFELGLCAIRFRDGRPCLVRLEVRKREGGPPESLCMDYSGPGGGRRLHIEKKPGEQDELYENFIAGWTNLEDVPDYAKMCQYTFVVHGRD